MALISQSIIIVNKKVGCLPTFLFDFLSFKVLLIPLVLLTSIVSFSQDSNENELEQAKAAARTWILNKTLTLPATYKGDEFYDFEEVIDLSPAADSAYQKWINSEFDVLKHVVRDTTGNVVITDSTKDDLKKLEEVYNSYSKEHVGYKIKHKFRAENHRGETLFYEAEFVMDRNFKMLETSMKERAKS